MSISQIIFLFDKLIPFKICLIFLLSLKFIVIYAHNNKNQFKKTKSIKPITIKNDAIILMFILLHQLFFPLWLFLHFFY